MACNLGNPCVLTSAGEGPVGPDTATFETRNETTGAEP
jgi:hypothetical protein